MALVTVQRSPTPSTTPESELEDPGEDLLDSSAPQSRSRSSSSSSAIRKLKKACNTVRFVSKLRLSESYLAVKGAALILPQSECYRRVTKGSHGGDIHSHLQSMCYLLRPQDTIKVAVKLESVVGKNRYLAVVSCIGRQDTEECLILGVDITEVTTIGLVLPILADLTIKLDGDGGFIVSSHERSHIFKPVSVQAMWSALQSLHKALDVSRTHYYFAGGLTHTWLGYYESKINSDRHALNEWNTMEDVESPRHDSMLISVQDKDSFEYIMRTKIKEIMMTVDLEEVTSKQIRTQLEKVSGMDLREYRSFIDEEILNIYGQMDSSSKIFDHLYLGSEWNASNLEELKANGVGYILNVTREIDNFFPGMFDYMNIRVYDVDESDLLKYWEKTYKFIRKAKKQGSKCLVHCKMGISRSASTVIAYAMKEYNWTLQEALNFVKEKRSCINPNKGFLAQLKTYQGILDASNQRNNQLWKSRSDQNLKKRQFGVGGEEDEDEDIAERLFYEEQGILYPPQGLRPHSWGPESDDLNEDIDMTETVNGKSITEQILAAKYADLPKSFVSGSFGFEKDVELSSRSADSLEEYFPDLPSPMETEFSVDDEEVVLLSFRSYANPDELEDHFICGAVHHISKGDPWESSSSEASEITAGFYNCLRLLGHDVEKPKPCDKGDKTIAKKIVPDQSWIKEVPPSPEVPKIMPTLVETDDQGVESTVLVGEKAEVQKVSAVEDDIPRNSGIVQKQKHGFEERLKQSEQTHDKRTLNLSECSEGASDVSSYLGSDEHINIIVRDNDSDDADRPRTISLGPEGMELLTESTTDDVSPEKSGDAKAADKSPEDKDKRASVLYENENIPLSPGLVRRTTQELEERNKTQSVVVKSPRPARRAESMKERTVPKVIQEDRRKTVTVPVTLQIPSPATEGSASDGASSPRSNNSFRPTPETSPIVSRRKKAKMSLKVDEDGDADEEDDNDPEDDSFLVFNIGDEEVVVKKGKVKRHTMDFEQLQGDLDKMIADAKCEGEVQNEGKENKTTTLLPPGANSQESSPSDRSSLPTSTDENKANSHDMPVELNKSKEVTSEEECPLPRGTVRLHKQAIEQRMSETGQPLSPGSPVSPPERHSTSPLDAVFSYPSSPTSDIRPDQSFAKPVTPPGASLQSDELPAAGIVRQHKEMIESRNRESVTEVDVDESVRMNKETLNLICRVGESLLNSPRDSEASSTEEDRLRAGFVRNIAKELEMKSGLCTSLNKSILPPLKPLDLDDAQGVHVSEKRTLFLRNHSDEFRRLGSLPDVRQCLPGASASRPSSLCVEKRAVHSAGEEEEVILRRHSVGALRKTDTPKQQRQVKSLVDKFETPVISPKAQSPPRMDTDESVFARDSGFLGPAKMDISPEQPPAGSVLDDEADCSTQGALASKPPRPDDPLGTWSSSRKVRKHHGKSHPLEKLSADMPSSGRTNNPLYNTM